MVNVKLRPPGQLDSVEGVNVAAGASAAQVTIKNETKVTLKKQNNDNLNIQDDSSLPGLPPMARCSSVIIWKFSSLPEEWNTAILGWMEKRKHSPVNVITIITNVFRGR